MAVLIDSNIWLDYFAGGQRARKVLHLIEQDQRTILISAINVTDLFHQFLKRKNKNDAEKMVELVSRYGFIVPVESSIALQAARLQHQQGLSLADALIYATAQEHHALLVTGDKDFKGMKDVEYIE